MNSENFLYVKPKNQTSVSRPKVTTRASGLAQELASEVVVLRKAGLVDTEITY